MIDRSIEGNDLGLFWGLLFSEETGEADAPGPGNDVQYVLAEEQQVVGNGDNGKEIVGEGKRKQIQQNNGKVNQCKEPGLDGDDEKQQEVGIGIQCGIAEEKTQIQIGYTGLASENQTVYIHHDNTCQIKQVKAECAPVMLHGPADGIVAEKGNDHQQGIGDLIREGIGDQPPDLTLEYFCTAEAKKVVQHVISGHIAHEIHYGISKYNIQHQIGNPFGSVFVTEYIKLSAKVFQVCHSYGWYL